MQGDVSRARRANAARVLVELAAPAEKNSRRFALASPGEGQIIA